MISSALLKAVRTVKERQLAEAKESRAGLDRNKEMITLRRDYYASLNDASDEATVIEVVGADRIGLLYRLTRAMSEFDLDIASAKVATIGSDVVDAFYVRDRWGRKITADADIAEITAGLLHVLLDATSR